MTRYYGHVFLTSRSSKSRRAHAVNKVDGTNRKFGWCLSLPPPVVLCEYVKIFHVVTGASQNVDRPKMTCNGDKVYSREAPSCQVSCGSLNSACTQQTVEGCVCPAGMVLDYDGHCVIPEQCSCIHEGKDYKAGETIRQDCNICVDGILKY
ncbi:hypothetical protein Bbelb_143330 [Branchiostoma belcheri]|nr:hypothetical protein Bbelb_143330 [Branchiostoma belcheri]